MEFVSENGSLMPFAPKMLSITRWAAIIRDRRRRTTHTRAGNGYGHLQISTSSLLCSIFTLLPQLRGKLDDFASEFVGRSHAPAFDGNNNRIVPHFHIAGIVAMAKNQCINPSIPNLFRKHSAAKNDTTRLTCAFTDPRIR